MEQKRIGGNRVLVSVSKAEEAGLRRGSQSPFVSLRALRLRNEAYPHFYYITERTSEAVYIHRNTHPEQFGVIPEQVIASTAVKASVELELTQTPDTQK